MKKQRTFQMEHYRSVNPFDQSTIKEYPTEDWTVIATKINAASNGQQKIKTFAKSKRADQLLKIAAALEQKKEYLAEIMTIEMGKPIQQSIAEIEKCAWVCRFYAENGPQHIEQKLVETNFSKSYVSYLPLGTLLAVMPWNFPFWQFFRVFAPNYLLGNNFILKHAPNVQGCAEDLTKLIDGIAANSVINIRPELEDIEKIIAHHNIKGVTLTGSTRAGKAVGQLAGKYLKPSVLELGGSNALVLLKDADIAKHIDTIFAARFQNTGQSCIAAKRIFVHEGRKDELIQLLKEKLESIRLENPLSNEAQVGSMARIDLAIELEKQINSSIQMGAKRLIGGARKNAYYPPTLLTNVTVDMPVFKEETFGPVACIITYSDESDMIQMVNRTEYGLGNSIFSDDIEHALHIGSQFESSALFINDMVKSDPRLPFGGIKNSGFGRELGTEALFTFCNIMTTAIQY